MTLLKCRYCSAKPKTRMYEGGFTIWCSNHNCRPPCYIWQTDKNEEKAIKSWNKIYGEKI